VEGLHGADGVVMDRKVDKANTAADLGVRVTQHLGATGKQALQTSQLKDMTF
jgi:hypothetical protein